MLATKIDTMIRTFDTAEATTGRNKFCIVDTTEETASDARVTLATHLPGCHALGEQSAHKIAQAAGHSGEEEPVDLLKAALSGMAPWKTSHQNSAFDTGHISASGPGTCFLTGKGTSSGAGVTPNCGVSKGTEPGSDGTAWAGGLFLIKSDGAGAALEYTGPTRDTVASHADTKDNTTAFAEVTMINTEHSRRLSAAVARNKEICDAQNTEAPQEAAAKLCSGIEEEQRTAQKKHASTQNTSRARRAVGDAVSEGRQANNGESPQQQEMANRQESDGTQRGNDETARAR
ncbi:hypothetical protein TRVL_04767 [Trypanosoma vivax]|nr:hypothetical protein TRVL_04767 [Trypanosoma vivax]